MTDWQQTLAHQGMISSQKKRKSRGDRIAASGRVHQEAEENVGDG
jgi:hypothetical protein